MGRKKIQISRINDERNRQVRESDLLTHCTLVDSSAVMDKSICLLRSVTLILFLMKSLLTNTVDPDRKPLYVASDLDLHCLPMTFLHVSR